MTTSTPEIWTKLPREMTVYDGAPIKSWTAEDISAVGNEKVYEQVRNLAQLPFVISHIALMPDAHAGYGMPIGGVLFADKAVVPYAIGVDIGCGVQVARTNLIWGENFDARKLKAVLAQIQRDVPTGFGTHKQWPMEKEELEDKLNVKGISVEDAYGLSESTGLNLQFLVERAMMQIGTLGGGNHFLEVQRDEDNRVYFMLHSGSRGLGKQTCDHYAKLALALNTKWNVPLPDKDLAFLPVDTVEHDAYMAAMNLGLRWAEINREQMMSKVLAAFLKQASVHTFEVLTDVHHNYAAWENHRGRNGIVHRKGAVSARLDELVLIPGSMGTNSYIAKGLGNEDAFTTCQHGAGRAHGRNEMKRMEARGEIDVFADMKARGIEFISNEPKSAVEEAVQAYKDVNVVMQASLDLIVPVTKLTPLGVVKG